MTGSGGQNHKQDQNSSHEKNRRKNVPRREPMRASNEPILTGTGRAGILYFAGHDFASHVQCGKRVVAQFEGYRLRLKGTGLSLKGTGFG
jgi:hypothetical protein